MHAFFRNRIFNSALGLLSLALPIASSSAYIAAIGEEASQIDNLVLGFFLAISSAPGMSFTGDSLQTIAMRRRAGAPSKTHLLVLAAVLALNQVFAGLLGQYYPSACNKDQSAVCEKITPLVTMPLMLVANLLTLAIAWPLAKWSILTPEELAAEEQEQRGRMAREQEAAIRAEERLIEISTLPNSEVVGACPITFALPENPVRLACPTGSFIDPAGNRVSTKIAFERVMVERTLNRQPDLCPMTRLQITRVVPAPDVLNREEPVAVAAADSLAEPLLVDAALEEGHGGYGTFARLD